MDVRAFVFLAGESTGKNIFRFTFTQNNTHHDSFTVPLARVFFSWQETFLYHQ